MILDILNKKRPIRGGNKPFTEKSNHIGKSFKRDGKVTIKDIEEYEKLKELSKDQSHTKSKIYFDQHDIRDIFDKKKK